MPKTPSQLRTTRAKVFANLRRLPRINTLVEGRPPRIVSEPLQFIPVYYSNDEHRIYERKRR